MLDKGVVSRAKIRISSDKLIRHPLVLRLSFIYTPFELQNIETFATFAGKIPANEIEKALRIMEEYYGDKQSQT